MGACEWNTSRAAGKNSTSSRAWLQEREQPSSSQEPDEAERLRRKMIAYVFVTTSLKAESIEAAVDAGVSVAEHNGIGVGCCTASAFPAPERSAPNAQQFPSNTARCASGSIPPVTGRCLSQINERHFCLSRCPARSLIAPGIRSARWADHPVTHHNLFLGVTKRPGPPRHSQGRVIATFIVPRGPWPAAQGRMAPLKLGESSRR